MREERRLKRKVRNSYMVSTISISLVLFLLGSVGYVMLRALDMADGLRDGAILNIELSQDVTPEHLEQLRWNIVQDPLAVSVVVVTREEKLADEDFRTIFGEDFESVLSGMNPLQDSFEVQLSTKDGADVDRFIQRVSSMQGVDKLYYPKELVDSINSTIEKGQYLMILFGGALLFISLVLIGNTVRLAIFSRRHLINTMKMVGATKWFIMRPFLWSGLKSGLLAGVISSSLFAGAIYLLRVRLPEIMPLSNLIEAGVISGVTILSGGLISLIFTLFSVNRFINMRSNKIHLF
ncbi:MAG: permease-like cell division protein FtsX [Rikenellaceae bacterium]